MLSLDDPRWQDLDHRGWSQGKRYDLDPDAPFVPDELARLREAPTDLERFRALWPYLCSESTTWAAAYAATPYIVELASRLPSCERLEHLYVIGLIAMCSCPESGASFEVKSYLFEDYRDAIKKALPLLTETLLCEHDSSDTRSLLTAAAALKGHTRLADVIDHLDCFAECPECRTEIFSLDL